MSKKKKRFFRVVVVPQILKMFTALAGIVPLSWHYRIGDIFGSLAYRFDRKHRKISIENLKVAFEDLSLDERKEMTRYFFSFLCQGTLELLHAVKRPDTLKNISIEGKENLDSALQQGKGVLLVTAHIGNFTLLSYKLAQEGYIVSMVARPMRDEKTGDYIDLLRTQSGVKSIFSYPRKECVNQIITALRKNEIVIIQMDQNFGTGGVWVKFFGKLAATPVGPIIFALRTQATVVPAYMWRKGYADHLLTICPQVTMESSDDKQEAVLLNAIKITRIIEGWIRKAPVQWSWIHRRWKSRPSETVKKIPYKVEEG